MFGENVVVSPLKSGLIPKAVEIPRRRLSRSSPSKNNTARRVNGWLYRKRPETVPAHIRLPLERSVYVIIRT
ncbi:MAG TPA: hypothetical protein DEB39_12910, partial [Planctomycetaceae bacterium]|nr:hypothetical protein [Planctomycetaceae bacterium]